MDLRQMAKTPANDFKSMKEKCRKELNEDEVKIFDSVLRSFPATDPLSAYDIAIQGGVKLEHYNR